MIENNPYGNEFFSFDELFLEIQRRIMDGESLYGRGVVNPLNPKGDCIDAEGKRRDRVGVIVQIDGSVTFFAHCEWD